jgi:hypothetical protein
MSYPVPILLIAFNRPDTTQQVLAILQQIQPLKLYLACDGPRPNRADDRERCAAVREGLDRGINWPCEVRRLFRETNLGCRLGVSGAIDWFFEQESEGIILEDDILPVASFFPYCQELLERYRDDQRVGSIAANHHQSIVPPDGSSYYFSIYSHIWGWATWRRAWQHYHQAMDSWPEFRRQGWLEQLGGAAFAERWTLWIDQADQGVVDTWDLTWQLACWQQGFLVCLPKCELIRNVGFGPGATHTLDEASPLHPPGELTFPLVHPQVMLANRRFDRESFRLLYRRSRRKEFRRKLLKGLRLLGLR